jgi:hypothetical protein
MELRFLEGNFEHGKFKLQYREPTIPPPNVCGTGIFYGSWKDVPCEKEELKWCEHWKQFKDDYNRMIWKPRQPPSWDNYTPDYCPWCGTRRP